MPLGQFRLVERGQVARPSAGEVLRIERCATQPPIGDSPVAAADAAFQFTEQSDEPVDIVGGDDPVGILRVLLQAILAACHPRREYARDTTPAKQSLKRSIEINGAAHQARLSARRERFHKITRWETPAPAMGRWLKTGHAQPW